MENGGVSPHQERKPPMEKLKKNLQCRKIRKRKGQLLVSRQHTQNDLRFT